MSVKLTILKTGETLISEMQELVSDKEQASPHAYLLHNPHKVKVASSSEFLTEEEKDQNKFGINVSMMPWIVLSEDKKIILPVDCVMTIVEPIEGVKKMFLDKCETFNIKEELND